MEDIPEEKMNQREWVYLFIFATIVFSLAYTFGKCDECIVTPSKPVVEKDSPCFVVRLEGQDTQICVPPEMFHGATK